MSALPVRPISADGFAPFGTIVAPNGHAARAVNQGRGISYDGVIDIEPGPGAGRKLYSIFEMTPSALPFPVEVMERHRGSSQAFVPMAGADFLVVVAPDDGGRPSRAGALAFRCAQGAGIVYARGVWHAPIIALAEPARLLMIMFEAPSSDQEIRLQEPWYVSEG